MTLLAQIPGADAAIKEAAKHSWEAVVLIVIIFAIVLSFGWALKRLMEDSRSRMEESRAREDRLAERVTNLEAEIRVELFNQLRITTTTMTQAVTASEKMVLAADRMISTIDKFCLIFESRPCLLSLVDHGKYTKEIEKILENMNSGT